MNITYAVIACVIVSAIILHHHEDKEKPKHVLYDPQYEDRWGRQAREWGL